MTIPDKIEITDLHLRAIIGINPEEREKSQDILINISLELDTRQAARSDDISDSANYRTITKNVITLVENSRFYLVESLAESIARICLEEPCIERAHVRVEKPSALRFAASVGITIARTRDEI